MRREDPKKQIKRSVVAELIEHKGYKYVSLSDPSYNDYWNLSREGFLFRTRNSLQYGRVFCLNYQSITLEEAMISLPPENARNLVDFGTVYASPEDIEHRATPRVGPVIFSGQRDARKLLENFL